MRIVHIYDGHEAIYEGQGSLPRIVWNVAKRTAARGHDVTILERQWDGLAPAAEREGVDFRRLRLRTGSDTPWEEVPYEMVEQRTGLGKLIVDRTNFGLKTLNLLRTLEFDAIHVHLPFAANVLVTIAPWLRSRMVFTAQLGELRLNALTDGTDGVAPDVPTALQRFSPDIHLARRVACTTVLNPRVKHIFEQNGISPQQVLHVPNGVDIAKFASVESADCERVRASFDLDGRPIVFFAGTIMPRKGVLELVQAAADVVDAGYDDVRFVLAGETDLDQEYFRRVRSVIDERGIETNVVFTGYLRDHDLLPAYKTADIFVLPSFEEGFGMVVSEAMATGTPPVASNINGVRQQIDDGETGLLVEPGSVQQLADAIEELLANPERRRQMGQRSQRRAQLFGWEAITDQYVDIYEELAA
ncbi:glycosyltransferase family 4 protein [Halococcus saccharolyticus]|uniref:Glycosyl transferase, group 1 family protein n=1 Tax=Halococcus saccharolyticus DSM 5350 TaxID=1227455 RepID=M0MK15_9EURY|nr:glycosyltransferase family 4 protein [Halococcus saccharolyticus]EMA44800.1 glycosyl transferase, group 1 family protein [Halococcus saccharolyticus DSM 5350]